MFIGNSVVAVMSRPEFLPEEVLDLSAHRASPEVVEIQKKRWDHLMNHVNETPSPDYGPGTPQVEGNCLLVTLPTSKAWGGMYGRIKVNGKDEFWHRFSWMFHRGLSSIPKRNSSGDEILIRHLCHRSTCISPNHLRSGTRESNADDSSKSGLIARGSKHPRSTIPDHQVVAIRASRFPAGHTLYKTQRERAKFFNLPVYTIADIDRRVTYTHVPESDGTLSDTSKAKRKYAGVKRRRKDNNRTPWTVQDWENARNYLDLTSTTTTSKIYNGCYCREWTGHIPKKHKSGIVAYGRAQVNGLSIHAHELSAIISIGCIHPGYNKVVSHLCHNPLCIEPRHLKFDSQRNNMLESAVAGRLAKIGDYEKVLEIRKAHYTGTPRKKLTCEFNVPYSFVRDVCIFKTWQHATTPEIDELYLKHMESKYPDPSKRPRDPREVTEERHANKKRERELNPEPLAYEGIFRPNGKRIKLPPIEYPHLDDAVMTMGADA